MTKKAGKPFLFKHAKLRQGYGDRRTLGTLLGASTSHRVVKVSLPRLRFMRRLDVQPGT